MSGYKKITMTHQQGTLGSVAIFYAPIWVMGFCVLYHQTIIFTWEMVFIIDGRMLLLLSTYALKSKTVSEMHFPANWRHKFTDLANSKKKPQSQGKKAVDKSAWIKASYQVSFSNFLW